MMTEKRKQTAGQRKIPVRGRKPLAVPLKKDGNRMSENESHPQTHARRRIRIDALPKSLGVTWRVRVN
jgi:hypothetical protein